MNVSESPKIVQHAGTVLLGNILELVIISFFSGIYTILMLCLIYLFYQGKVISRAKSYMFAITLLTFFTIAIICLYDIIDVIQTIPNLLILAENQTLENKFSKINQDIKIYNTINLSLQIVNALLGNTVIVWRAQTLWANHYIMVLLKGILIVTIIASISNCVLNSIGSIAIFDLLDYYSLYLQMIQWGLEIIMNSVVTILIAYKAWSYRQSVKTYLAKNKKTQIENILALLVESGILYCALWIALIISEFTSINGLEIDIFSSISMVFTGIYPTLIMIVVSLNSTVEEMSGISISTIHTSIQQELENTNIPAEAEVFHLQTFYEHNIVPNAEIIEETQQD
ncbi:hypothetical protein HETIRDRAFT_324082 [Heterobasidion irregulare TC 32-1]|uniref:Uncharacterized protein n=1 Tax=Heterobasidion irregulare (strain TC 32-1) TaxID=747525 RepID=W4JYI6_HETIT|nr:uncharacterized protein HETIRDRAFT_324082 [Heterobasidion irregulare TC 32-1]ETW78608.1 hypothetical protein HETIRDRAFT_324082 [Heterobasidion irregulare TC 32-1]